MDGRTEGPLWEAWSYCKRQSKSVELFYKNMDGDKILTRVHFPFDPAVSGGVCVGGRVRGCVSVCECVLLHSMSCEKRW